MAKAPPSLIVVEDDYVTDGARLARVALVGEDGVTLEDASTDEILFVAHHEFPKRWAKVSKAA